MKSSLTHLPSTTHALSALGAQISIARREMGWTTAELAERLGVTARLVSRIEAGAASTGVGTVFEAAILCGVPLFETDAEDVRAMALVAEIENLRLALLPSRVRPRNVKVANDF